MLRAVLMTPACCTCAPATMGRHLPPSRRLSGSAPAVPCITATGAPHRPFPRGAQCRSIMKMSGAHCLQLSNCSPGAGLRAITQRHHDAQPPGGRAAAALRLHRYDVAAADAQHAARRDPGCCRALVRGGRAHLGLQRPAEAASLFSEALQQSPDDGAARARECRPVSCFT